MLHFCATTQSIANKENSLFVVNLWRRGLFSPRYNQNKLKQRGYFLGICPKISLYPRNDTMFFQKNQEIFIPQVSQVSHRH